VCNDFPWRCLQIIAETCTSGYLFIDKCNLLVINIYIRHPAIWSMESFVRILILIPTYNTAWRHISQPRTFNVNRCENFKSQMCLCSSLCGSLWNARPCWSNNWCPTWHTGTAGCLSFGIAPCFRTSVISLNH